MQRNRPLNIKISSTIKAIPQLEAIRRPVEIPDDGVKQLIQQCVLEAVEIVKEVNTIPWQNEDVRAISLTLFIQRSKIG